MEEGESKVLFQKIDSYLQNTLASYVSRATLTEIISTAREEINDGISAQELKISELEGQVKQLRKEVSWKDALQERVNDQTETITDLEQELQDVRAGSSGTRVVTRVVIPDDVQRDINEKEAIIKKLNGRIKAKGEELGHAQSELKANQKKLKELKKSLGLPDSASDLEMKVKLSELKKKHQETARRLELTLAEKKGLAEKVKRLEIETDQLRREASNTEKDFKTKKDMVNSFGVLQKADKTLEPYYAKRGKPQCKREIFPMNPLNMKIGPVPKCKKCKKVLVQYCKQCKITSSE